MALTLRDKIRKVFDYDIIDVSAPKQQILVYFLRDPQGREWVPYGGGPLYRESAISQAAWLARHIAEFRDLLPKACRDWAIVFGELNCRSYPGKFYPMQLPTKVE